jgi:NAD(P)-dependent dehydrogenase (short-subunit alcohol dehydrogenase family)
MKNKVVLITGGTSGIGKTTAFKFAAEGAKVVVSGRREPEGQAVVDAIKADGGEATFIRADISEESEVKNLVEQTVATYGGLDVAFNNAGVEITGPIPEITEADYQKVFSINVWGVLTSLKHEIPAMLASGGGSIINTSSVAGHIGMPGVSVYVASKHAVEGLTKVAALEYATSGIRVNAVAPGLIATDMADRFAGDEGSEERDQLGAMHPIGREGRSEEVANAVYFLASDAASFTTGESLKVDGGWLAQ